MSEEFFSIMQNISDYATKIKFLEGSHPEIFNSEHQQAESILQQLKMMEDDIVFHLEQKAKKQITPVKKKKK